ncbi:hypothetical protein EJB05_01863 [Eragrostis curvula]|uniref:J domain-containing protein n=1 Tax=Eragrostis curvula TaxID=38414 RepID=A0A5J9WQU9_9POAL|nr:hypothetical protein EJB05_01863 [Eragrostis curvula]
MQAAIFASRRHLYGILSVTEDATCDEIRAAYKCAARILILTFMPSHEQQEFLSMQKAWEVLHHHRLSYD